MAPRIAIAGFLHETNTFAPMPTVFENFVVEGDSYAGFRRGPEILDVRGKRINSVVAGFLDVADPLGYEIVPLTWACAEPAGQVTANAFEKIMGLIAAGLSDQGPFDGVFLDLHGAMVFEGFHDGETEILRRVRAIVGDIPIVAALDLHGNIALPSVEYASVLIGYRTYPHIDLFETGQRAAQAISYLVSGKPLHKAFRQLPFLVPISAQSTNTEPCRSLYALIDEVEQDPRVISATIMAGS
ncbi:MAG: M81 family metallopeptidase, partial [Chloroflexi bacterium]|nr:M81 family metallopeptidase [Chloroflexota bacterium]